MKTFLLAINGIYTSAQGPESNWAQMTPGYVVGNGWWDDSAAFAYTDSMMGATIALERQAGMVAADLEEVRTEYTRVDLVGHSNAARLICEALKRGVHADTVAIAAGAVDEDCETNGLNQAAREGRIKRVVLFVSSGDEVLALPVAYGKLGRNGPKNVCPELAAILTVMHGTCGHSDWVGRLYEPFIRAVHEFSDTSSTAAAPLPSDVWAALPGGAA